MSATLKSHIGISGGGETTPDRESLVNSELEFARMDIERLKAELTQTRNVKKTVSERLDKFRAGVASLNADLHTIVEKETAQVRMLRSRKLSLIDLEMEIE